MRAGSLALALALAACSDGGGAADMHVPDMAVPPLCSPDQIGDAGVPGTFANVEKIIDGNCAFGVCHFAGFSVKGGTAVDLTHGHAYLDLVNKSANDLPNQCGGPLVTPGDPSRSYLMVKLTKPKGQQCNPDGSQMPFSDGVITPLDDCLIDIVRRWILAGAPP